MKTAIEIIFYGVLLFASVAVWTTTSTFVDDEDEKKKGGGHA